MKMMKQIYQLSLILLLIAGSFVACEKDINFKGSISDPIPVLNSLLSPDSAVSLQLMQTRFILGEMSPYSSIPKAEVSLFVNGTLKEQLIHIDNGNYRGGYHPQPGDRIKIEVTGSGFDKLTSETVIPNRPNVMVTDSVVTINENEYENEQRYPYQPNSVSRSTYRLMELQLTLTDTDAEENFYHIRGKKCYYDDEGLMHEWPIDLRLSEVLKNNIMDSSDELYKEIFGDDSDDWNRLDNLFTDRFVNGKSILFDFSFVDIIEEHILAEGEEVDERFYDTEYEVEYVIEISEISKGYYHYLISANRAVNIMDFGFLAEPVMIYSNIENGVGILGSYSSYRFSSKFKSYRPY